MSNTFSEMCNHDIILCITTIATYIPLYFMMSSFDDNVTNTITKYQAKIDLLIKENEELKEKLKIYEDEESVWEDIDTDDEEEYEISRTCYECECVVISEKYIHVFDGKRYCGGCNPEPISTDEGTDEGIDEGTDEGINKMPLFYELIQNTFNDYIMLLINVKKVLRLILNIILNQIYSLFEQYIEKDTSYGN